MRNFDDEIKELEKEIKNLELTKNEKKTQLERIKNEQREQFTNKEKFTKEQHETSEERFTNEERIENEEHKKFTNEERIENEEHKNQQTQQESTQNRDRTLRDFYGKPILVGDWVNVTRKGKFSNIEGIVTKIKKWVTFEDRKGVKQYRAPHNLIVSDLPANYHVRNHNAGGILKRECN